VFSALYFSENLHFKHSQVETLALNGVWHTWETTTKLKRIFSIFLRNTSETKVKVFPKLKYNFFFKRKCFCFETKVKLLFLKRKDVNLQTISKVFPKRKYNFFKTKMFYLETICETKVFCEIVFCF